LNVQKIFPKLTSKIAKNEYRTQNNKRYLTQNRYRGVLGKGVLEKRYMFLFSKRNTLFGNIGRKRLLGAQKTTLLAKQETA
jgi:hypothetical protein